LSKIVVIDFRVFAEQSLDQIAVVVENESDRLETKAVELADFLVPLLRMSGNG
jgi:hypothetical protein